MNHLRFPFAALWLCFAFMVGVAAETVGQDAKPLETSGKIADRWKLNPVGVLGIEWRIPAEDAGDTLPHGDNIEMAGKRVAGIVSWEIDEKRQLTLSRKIFFPQLHPVLKHGQSKWAAYRSYLTETVDDTALPRMFVGGKEVVPGPVDLVRINGHLSFTHAPVAGLQLTRMLLPSPGQRLFREQWRLANVIDIPITVTFMKSDMHRQTLGWSGRLTVAVRTDAPESVTLEPHSGCEVSLAIIAADEGEALPSVDSSDEWHQRQVFMRQVGESLVLQTPDPTLNELFRFSKIRAAENIFESKLGLIHSPGGGRYYVGIWANDQAEYINPLFPYLGYEVGNQSAMNCYRAFAAKMNDEYRQLPYSFEIEGLVDPIFRDRGDAAMIAYGAAHFALASGSQETAKELWPLIEWCLEYCDRQRNEAGVIKSDTDEMEGRIETGTANLSTSSLYYGALNHAVDLATSLELPTFQHKGYADQATALRAAIESYFGANVEGLDTYRYYDGHQTLRHWVCLPLVVGIHDRKADTIEALFDRLWTPNGVHVEKNNDDPKVSKIFWDRGTLYALRGTFIAGETERSLEKLAAFSQERLLGQRVPYVVEAYPEGNMAHLSAESGLYCRVFTEGMFGINPTGLKSFTLTPRLPAEWNFMALRAIKAFGSDFDIVVQRKDQQLHVRVIDRASKKDVCDQLIDPGSRVDVRF